MAKWKLKYNLWCPMSISGAVEQQEEQLLKRLNVYYVERKEWVEKLCDMSNGKRLMCPIGNTKIKWELCLVWK